MSKSVDNPIRTEVPEGKRLAALRTAAVPTVRAYEIAQELGIHPTTLSNFERGKRDLPDGMGPRAYERALQVLVERKRGTAA